MFPHQFNGESRDSAFEREWCQFQIVNSGWIERRYQHFEPLYLLPGRLVDQFRSHTKPDLAPVSMHKEIVCLKSFLKWAKARKLVTNNPLQDVQYKRPRSTPRSGPNLEQINRILKNAPPSRQPQLAILAFTGMRSSELRHLLSSDIDLKGNWIHIVSRPGAETKTGASRKVPIHPRLRLILEALPKSSSWLFQASPSPRYPTGGHWINTKHLNEDFLKLLGKLDLPAGRDPEGQGYTIHSLRHSFETVCVNARVPQLVIDSWLGHQGDRSMAKVYYGLADKESQKFIKDVPFGTG